MTFERIVVGTDGSDTAGRAVAEAASLAVLHGAGLLIATTYGEPTGVDLAEAERRVQDGAEIADAAGLPGAATATVEGSPAEALVALAETHAADLLVVGSKGMTDESRFVLGSVANHVSHHAPCDVLIARTSHPGLDFRPAAVSGNIVE